MTLSSAETAAGSQPQFVCPTEYDLRATRHYAADVLPQEDSAFAVAPAPQTGQTLLRYANTVHVVADTLRAHPNDRIFLVMTRATRHEAASLLEGRTNVSVETVTE